MQLRYALTQVTAPDKEPLDTDAAKAHLRVENDDENALIDNMIAAARREAETFMGRALITQSWGMDIDRFPAGSITVPRPRLQSVGSIKCLDTNGSLQTLAESKYRVDTKREPGRITPAFGEVWPSTRAVINAVSVRFTAGYGAEPKNVPEDIRQAMLLIVGRSLCAPRGCARRNAGRGAAAGRTAPARAVSDCPGVIAGRLNRRITLLEPADATRSRYGAVKPGKPRRHEVWAARLDRGGGERLQSSAQVGSWQTRFTVRQSAALRGIDRTWSLIDERGRKYDIEALGEIGRREGWLIYATAKS